MPDFRKVFGPFGRTQGNVGGEYVEWGFFGILSDYDNAHWTLHYDVQKRKFRATRSKPQPVTVKKGHARGTLSIGQLVELDMFIKGEKLTIVSGNISDVLRARLPPEDVALCASLSLKVKRP